MSYFEKRPDGSYTPNPQPPQHARPAPHSYTSAPQQHAPVPHAAQPHTQNAHQRPPQYESTYQTQHSLRYDPAPQRQQPPPKKKPGSAKFLGGTALVLACAVAGFGGSAAAVTLFYPSNNSAVVYQSVGGQATAEGISTDATTLSDIAQNSLQSVVSIQTETQVTDMFNQLQDVTGAGSGVIISSDGLILTNNHVVENSKSVLVTLSNGTQYKATIVGTDSATDVALLRIEADNLTPAVLADSSEVQVGDFCLAIGNPTGNLSGTVTDGIISALEREITIQNTPMTLMQMSAPVSPGNSGGGLFNANGELVGLVNAKNSGDGSEGLGFAIPINTAMEVAEELLEHGYVQGRPFLGISSITVTEENAAMAGVSEPGLYITAVTAGSGAEQAGLQVGDRIVAFEDTKIDDLADLSFALAEFNPGDTVTLEIERGGETGSVSVTLQEQQAPTA